MSEKIRTLLFTVVITAVFTLLVSGVNALLKERIDLNRSVARQKVILGLFGALSVDQPVDDAAIPAFFSEQIEKVELSEAVECYRRKNSAEEVFVFAFAGQGFWDKILGFLALDMQNMQIRGIEFTSHGETPGLGGRISEPEFKARFKDRSFAAKRGDGLYLKLVPEGTSSRPDEVDAITGATGTSSAVEKIVNQALLRFISLKQGGRSK